MSNPTELLEAYVFEAGYEAMRDRLEQEDTDTIRGLLKYSEEDVIGEVCRDVLHNRRAYQ